MNNNYNNNALTPRQIGMLVVFVVVTAYMLYISIKGMKEETRKMKESKKSKESKTSNYEIQGAKKKSKDNAMWIPLSIVGAGIIATGVGIYFSDKRVTKLMKRN